MEVPNELLDKLNNKLCNDIFDIGNVIGYNDDNQWLVSMHDLEPFDDIYLIDHAWTIESLDSAYSQLYLNHDLVKRLISMTNNIPNDIDINDKVIDDLFQQIIYLFGSYYYNDSKAYYIMDEVGNHLQPAKTLEHANCMSTLVQTDTCAYTVLWMIKKIQKNDLLLCYNLPSGINKYSCLTRVLDNADDIIIRDCARALKDVLHNNEYTAIKINSMIENHQSPYLQCWEHADVSSKQKRAELLYARYGHENKRLVILITLFYLGVSINKDDVVAILGSYLVTALVSLNIFLIDNDMISSLTQFTPVYLPEAIDEDLIVMTDFAHHGCWTGLGLEEPLNPVMYIGPDSLGLLHFFQSSGRQCLDICAGTGIQSIAAIKQKKVETVTCVDINPRAIKFLGFNALLNDIDMNKFTIVNADVTDHDDMNILKEHDFDLVLFNPPYIPSDKDDDDFQIFGSGGEHGEEIIKSVATFLSKRKNKIDCYMVANFINCYDYPQKLNTWFKTECRGCLFHGLVWSPSQYSELVMPTALFRNSHDKARLKYEQYLIKTGVKDIVNGVLAFSFNNDDYNDNNKVSVFDMKNEIWQVLSSNNITIKTEIREKLKSTLLIK